MRRGIRALINDQSDLKICGEASTGTEAVQKEEELRPDLIVMDLRMPGISGLSAATKICDSRSTAKILIFTNQEFAGTEQMASLAGCDGIVRKVNASRDLLVGIRTVLNGEKFYPTLAKAHHS